MHEIDDARTLLVVDDEELLLRLCLRILVPAGFRVLTADGGEAAVKICTEFQGSISVALLDVMMPKMSGPELAPYVIKLHPETSIVFMSGYEDYRLEKYRPFSFKWFLRKPFKPADLLAMIRIPLEEVKKRGPRREENVTYIRKAGGELS